jgi:glycosyltransferase involved in cell wall biosynthesis
MAAISVIIPIFNVEAYISKCLDSVFNQPFTDIELICINDGSPDKSRDIVIEYQKKHPNIRLIDRENGGLSAARNTGIKNATGKYLLFLDSDDYLSENILGAMYQQLEAENLDVLLGNIQWVYEDGKVIQEKQITDIVSTVQTGENCFNTLIETDYYVPMAYNAIGRRDFIVKNNLFFEEGYVYEDEMWTPEALLKAKRVNGFSEYHYNYFQRANTITNSELSDYKLKCMLQAANHIIELSENDKDISDRTKANLWLRAYIIWGLFNKNKGNIKHNLTSKHFSVKSLLQAKLPPMQFEKCLQNIISSKFGRRFYRIVFKSFIAI